MKKLFVILVIAVLVIMMTACSLVPYTCDLCGEKKTSTKHTTKVLGEEVTICDECYEELNGLFGK